MPKWSDTQPADSVIQNIATEVKEAVRRKIQATMIRYVATLYQKQEHSIMTGKMYLIKVDIGTGSNFLHIEVFHPETKSCELLAVEESHVADDAFHPLV